MNGQQLPNVLGIALPDRKIPTFELGPGTTGAKQALSSVSVTSVRTEVPSDAHTAPYLGIEREGNAVLINSDGQKGAVVGDLLHNIAQVSEPTWCAGVDTDKAQSAASREKLLDQAEKEGWIIAAGHFPPGKQVGKVVRAGDKRLWQSL